MAQENLIDRDFLERLERLTLRWRKSLPGTIGGHNPSRLPGAGQEFLDHRNFHHGDDLRSVNWRAYMRLEKLFLKVFQMEPHIPIRLLLDVSNSMTTGEKSKFPYMQRLAAAISYIGVLRLETICIQPYNDTLQESLVSGGGRHRFAPATRFLNSLQPGGHSDTTKVVKGFAERFDAPGLLIMISDFLEEGDCFPALEMLARLGHELFLIQVFADEDREPPWLGQLEIRDAESGKQQQLEFDEEAQARYVKAFDEYTRELQRVVLRNEGRFAAISTSLNLDEVLFSELSYPRGAIA
jgi:uncharacterized protein (DUF58 family)